MFALVRGDLEDDQFRAEMARANRSVSYAGSSPYSAQRQNRLAELDPNEAAWQRTPERRSQAALENAVHLLTLIAVVSASLPVLHPLDNHLLQPRIKPCRNPSSNPFPPILRRSNRSRWNLLSFFLSCLLCIAGRDILGRRNPRQIARRCEDPCRQSARKLPCFRKGRQPDATRWGTCIAIDQIRSPACQNAKGPAIHIHGEGGRN